MADFSLAGGSAFALESGLDLANVAGTAVAANASANTKGSWVELESAAGNTFSSIKNILSITEHGGSQDSRFLVDLGIGGAGSEVVIAENLFSQTTTTTNGSSSFIYDLPIGIPAGTRIAARVQATSGSAVAEMDIIRIPSSFRSNPPLGAVLAIGADTSTTSGVLVARSSSGVFGSWVEMTASLSESIKGFIASSIRAAVSYTSQATVTYEVGIGSAGNEEVIFSGWLTPQSNSESMWATTTPFIPVSINSGTRISIRAASNVANTDLDLDYIIYGVR